MRWIMLGIMLAPVASLAGCGARSDAGQADLLAAGTRFLLPEEPQGAVGILEHRESVPAGEEPPQLREVVLWGKIGGKKQTWSGDSAEFVISDPTFALAAGDHVCQDDNCPFCKDKHDRASAEAIVSLVDDQGQVPAVDARKLLGLEEGQMVVVCGQAEVNSLGLLTVRASGLYVRR